MQPMTNEQRIEIPPLSSHLPVQSCLPLLPMPCLLHSSLLQHHLDHARLRANALVPHLLALKHHNPNSRLGLRANRLAFHIHYPTHGLQLLQERAPVWWRLANPCKQNQDGTVAYSIANGKARSTKPTGGAITMPWYQLSSFICRYDAGCSGDSLPPFHRTRYPTSRTLTCACG